MYTSAAAFLEALVEQGITHAFVNLGSDHPGLVEAIAMARALGNPVPRMITCPNEMVALSMAHGYAQVSGEPQAVIIHVECGTQALAGAVHNVAKGRVPVLIFAGSSPFTQEGEMIGSRNEFIQWIQDVHDQRGLVRGYMRYDNEIRTGANVKQMVHRAMQFAKSDPKGPVYLMMAREVMEAECEPREVDMNRWQPLEPTPLGASTARKLVDCLATAKRPLIVTSYLGRNPDAVAALAEFSIRLGIGVMDSVPSYVNLPHDHPMYLGNFWNEPSRNIALAEADFVLVIDSDVPWIPTKNRPDEDARIYHIDVDPLKEQMPLWYIEPHGSYRADAATALAEMIDALDNITLQDCIVEERAEHYRAMAQRRRRALEEREQEGDGLTIARLMAALRRHVDTDTILLNEGITNYQAVFDHLSPTQAGTMFASGGGSLGWNGGAALGVKLARPDATVVAVTGDGSYMFTTPSSVHWISRRYDAPFLQIVLNNDGWNAPRHSALAVHPSGCASKTDDLDLSFSPAPDYGGIAAASGGAATFIIDAASDADAILHRAFETLKQGCSVVVEARLS